MSSPLTSKPSGEFFFFNITHVEFQFKKDVNDEKMYRNLGLVTLILSAT